VYTQSAQGGIVITELEPGGSAAGAGAKPGDYLISVGEIPIDDQQFGERFRAKFGGAAEGAALTIRVRRGSETLNLTGKLQFAPGDVRIVEDPRATPKAIRIRAGLLGSTR
jgi:S1-C subfamily serine protease